MITVRMDQLPIASFNPDELPSDAENSLVWCERCQREHLRYPMTKEKWSALLTASAQALAASVNERVLHQVMRDLYGEDA